MSQFPFTPKGVQDVVAHLYALSNPELGIEANAIEEGFKRWLVNYFAFTPEQMSFLTALDNTASQYYGQQCALCFRNRLQIFLIYPTPPTNPGYAKWPVSSNTIQYAVDGNGNAKVSGALIFTMTYVTN